METTLIIIGYLSALAIGIALGLFGGGGAILGVPILVYLMGMEELKATGLSLFVVGATSLVGAIQFWMNNPSNRVEIQKTALIFAPPSILIGILIRKLIQTYVPDILFTIGQWEIKKGMAIMLIFAVVMVFAARSMLINKKSNVASDAAPKGYQRILQQAVTVGIMAGITGAGGGFLITPALVNGLKMNMKLAVGTSLWIISANSWFIFLGDQLMGKPLLRTDWFFLLIFTAIAVVGIFIGMKLTQYLPAEKLKKGFGYFVLITATLILCKELFLR